MFTELDDSHLRRAFRGAMKLCRIENFHFHDLRHTFATRLVQSGIDLYKVQCLLGHKSPIMTQRYAHHYPESLREGVEMLAGYSLPSTGGHKFSTHATSGRTSTGREWRKLLKNLVGRVGVEPTAR
jgi:integrase-like protein